MGDSYRDELKGLRKGSRANASTVGRKVTQAEIARTTAVRLLAKKKKAQQMKLWS